MCDTCELLVRAWLPYGRLEVPRLLEDDVAAAADGTCCQQPAKEASCALIVIMAMLLLLSALISTACEESKSHVPGCMVAPDSTVAADHSPVLGHSLAVGTGRQREGSLEEELRTAVDLPGACE